MPFGFVLIIGVIKRSDHPQGLIYQWFPTAVKMPVTIPKRFTIIDKIGVVSCANKIESGIINNVVIQRTSDANNTFIMIIFDESYMMNSKIMVKRAIKMLAVNE